jgi:hypothetical protein
LKESDAHVFINEEGKSEIFGRNYEFIHQLIDGAAAYKAGPQGTNIVDSICKTDALFPSYRHKSSRFPSSLVLIIQLCLLHFSLDPFTCHVRAPRFYDSQQHVYKCYSKEPIFMGKNNGDINLPWLLHVANFFKFHLKQPGGEGMLSHMYRDLGECERPRQWRGRLKAGTQELGKRWKGAYGT